MQTQATTMPLGSMPVPMPTGSLEAYVQTVNRFPMLSAEEERALAQRFRAEGDLEAARSMVLSHLRLVVAVAPRAPGPGLAAAGPRPGGRNRALEGAGGGGPRGAR